MWDEGDLNKLPELHANFMIIVLFLSSIAVHLIQHISLVWSCTRYTAEILMMNCLRKSSSFFHLNLGSTDTLTNDFLAQQSVCMILQNAIISAVHVPQSLKCIFWIDYFYLQNVSRHIFKKECTLWHQFKCIPVPFTTSVVLCS